MVIIIKVKTADHLTFPHVSHWSLRRFSTLLVYWFLLDLHRQIDRGLDQMKLPESHHRLCLLDIREDWFRDLLDKQRSVESKQKVKE